MPKVEAKSCHLLKMNTHLMHRLVGYENQSQKLLWQGSMKISAINWNETLKGKLSFPELGG